MPITIGGQTYTDQQIQDFYASGGNDVQFAADHGADLGQVQAARTIGKAPNGIINAAAQPGAQQANPYAAVDDAMKRKLALHPDWKYDASMMQSMYNETAETLGVNNWSKNVDPVTSMRTYDAFWSPTLGKTITSADVKNFMATNPSQTQVLEAASNLGIGPGELVAALGGAGALTGASTSMNGLNYGSVGNMLGGSLWQGTHGYVTDARGRIAKGLGHTFQTYSDGSGTWLAPGERPHNDDASIVAMNARTGQAAGTSASIPSLLPANSAQSNVQTPVNAAALQMMRANGGAYQPDGRWSDLVDGVHTGTTGPGQLGVINGARA